MQNHALLNLAQQPVKQIIRRLATESSSIFGEYNAVDYQNLVAVFARLNQERLNDDNMEDLRELIDYGIVTIARRYESGQPIHPGTMNILIMAIQAYNQAHGQPYQFDIQTIRHIMPVAEEFMVDVVEPMTRNLQLLALHHAEWINPEFAAQEAERRAHEEAPGAETRIVRTLAEFRAIGGDQMEAACPVCMDAFIEPPMKGRGGVFMPVVVHKDAKGKWFHPMHTACVNDLIEDKCPMCRAKVIWPRMMLTRKRSRRPTSDPMPRRSVKRSSKSPGKSPKSPGKSPGKSPKSPGKSPKSPKSPGKSPGKSPKKRSSSVKRRSADF